MPLSQQPVRPTEGELEILQGLWHLGPSTVRQVQAHLGSRTGYTSVLKLMQIMLAKGILARDARGKTHVYRPAQAQNMVQTHLASDLIDRAFGGSARMLIVAALSGRRASEADVQEIQRLLETYKQAPSKRTSHKGKNQ